MTKFKEHPKLKDEIIHILQKMKQVGQPFSTCIMQPILKGLLQAITFEFISKSNFIK
jgi:aspartate-semialdehyde dehydrogenase